MNTKKNDNQNLWEQMKETINPLEEKKRNLVTPKIPEPPQRSTPRAPKPSVGSITKALPKKLPLPFKPSPIDHKTYKLIATKKIKIDGRIDLHKRTQEEAKSDLQKFFASAQVNSQKIVLVITGKGVENKGILKANVPRWLEIAPLDKYVNGFCVAHKNHGGDGALYVRIRKK